MRELQSRIDKLEDSLFALRGLASALVYILDDAGFPVKESLNRYLSYAASELENSKFPEPVPGIDALRDFYAEQLRQRELTRAGT